MSITETARAMVAYRDALRRPVIPANYPEWPKSLVALREDDRAARADAVDAQLRELASFLAKSGIAPEGEPWA